MSTARVWYILNRLLISRWKSSRHHLMPAYDTIWFDPPAPLARVVLRNGNTGATWTEVPMLLDTGADITLVPHSVVEHLGIEANLTTQFELEGFDGNVSIAQAVQLEFIFLRRTFRGQFLLADQEWGIIGRNILNALTITLDGPSLTWDEIRRK